MSNVVDRRVVEMQFDNRDFENNIKTSMQSLGKLKESLKLEDSAKELKAFQKTAGKFSLDGMISAAESMTSKFSVMGTVGDQVLRRLTDSAITAFYQMKRFVDSLTIDAIYSGFDEYNTQINSIQTILSNTREDLTSRGFDDAGRLGEVTAKLDELNSYADKTIYNFTEMTRNIGTFTAAGVDLYTAVDSIKGIANLAAISGSTSEQASRAMYQLSQAISSGTVKLMDWNSVVNAGMGGKIFQDALVRTARAMKVTVNQTVKETNKKGKKISKNVNMTVDQLIEKQGSFRESLSTGWLSADVLTATLEQFSWDFEEMAREEAVKMGKVLTDNLEEGINEQMEKKKIQLLAQGYTLDEAETIVQLAKDAAEAATKVKTIPQLFDTLKEAAQSGWTKTWEFIIGNFEEAKETLSSMGDYFGRLIDISSDSRNVIMQEWHENGGYASLWNNDEKKGPLGSFWNLVYGIKNIVSTIREEFQKVFPPATAKNLLDFTNGIQSATEKFRKLTENSEKMERFRTIIAGVASALGIAKTGIGYVFKAFSRLFGIADPFRGGLLDMAAEISEWISKAKTMMDTFDGFKMFCERVKTAIDSISIAIGDARDAIGSFFNNVKKEIVETDKEVSKGNFFLKLGNGISEFVGKIPGGIEKLKTWVKGVAEYIRTSERIQKVWGKGKSLFSSSLASIKGFGDTVKKTLSEIFNFDEPIDNGDGTKTFPNVKDKIEALGLTIEGWFDNTKNSIETTWNRITGLLTTFFTQTIPAFFSSGKIGMSAMIEKIKSIDWMEVVKTALGIYSAIRTISVIGGIASIGGGLKRIGKGLKQVGKGIGDIVKNGITITKEDKDSIGNTLLKIAGAIGVIVGSIYILSKMDTASVATGIGIISFIAAELLAVSFVFGKINANGKSFIGIAAALTLMIVPISLLGSMDAEKALKGIFAIGAILTEISICMRLAGNGKKGGFIGLAVGITLMVEAVKNLAELDGGSMAKGLVGMEVLLLEMASFAKKSSSVGKISGMIGLAIAVNLLATAVKKMGALNAKTIGKGLVGLGGIMIAFGTMVKMTKGMAIGSALAILLTMAGSIILFVEAFKQVDGMDMDNMLKFALSISSVMLAIGIAIKSVSSVPITGAISGLGSLAVWLVGVGAILLALGKLSEEWEGMTGLLDRGGDVLGQIGTAIGKFIGGIGGGIFGIENLSLAGIGTDLSNFMTNASGFIEGAKNIDTSIVTGVGSLCAALLALSGTEIVNAFSTLLSSAIIDESTNGDFSTRLVSFGDGLKGFAGAISSISKVADEADFNCANETATSLSKLNSSLPSTGGKLQEWLGEKNLTLFSDSIPKLAVGSLGYAKNINGFSDIANDNDFKVSIATAESLGKINTSLPSTGGKLQEWLGEKNLTLFSESIPKLGNGLMLYAQTINGFNSLAKDDDFEKANATAESLGKINNSLPSTGGKLQEWLGEKNLTLFSESIPKLADGLISYATKINNFSSLAGEDDFKNANSTATSLSDLNNSLPSTEGKLQDWLGEKNIKLFSEGIVKLSTGLCDYATNIKGFSSLASPEDFSKAEEIAESLSDLNRALPSTGGTLAKWIYGEQDLGLFSTNIALLGNGLRAFAESIAGLSVTKTDDAIMVMDVIKCFQDELEKTGGIGQMFSEFFEGSTENTLVRQSATMATFGQNLKTFCDSIIGLSTENIGQAFSVLNTYNGYLADREKSGGLFGSIGKLIGGESDTIFLLKCF